MLHENYKCGVKLIIAEMHIPVAVRITNNWDRRFSKMSALSLKWNECYLSKNGV